jgi:hypothetical protein
MATDRRRRCSCCGSAGFFVVMIRAAMGCQIGCAVDLVFQFEANSVYGMQ